MDRMQRSLLLLAICLFVHMTPSSSFSRFSRMLHSEPWKPVSLDRTDDVTEKFITQRLDNFDPQNDCTFQMRYFKNEKYAKIGGPIFIFLGGEWKISEGMLINSYMRDMGEELGGLLLYPEHRFYGESRPTPTLGTENLKYLSVDQALADFAHFISNIKKNYRYTNSSVIVVGASYSATMAIWMRQKYPHLVDGAWASSGPVLAQFDFKEYKENMGQAIALVGGDDCLDAAEAGFALTEELIETGQYKKLRQLFNLCDDFNPADKLNVWNFMYEISEVFAGIVQGHKPGIIEGACKEIIPSNRTNIRSTLNTFGNYVARSFRLVSSNKCLQGNYADTLDVLRNTNYTSLNVRQWLYQSCTEFGWFQTSSSIDHPFGSSFPIHLFTRLCEDVFDKKFTKGNVQELVLRKNAIYGGMEPSITNVVFTQGQLDPWRTIGIQKSPNKDAIAIVIPGASHCRDLASIDLKHDSWDMIYAKITIGRAIRSWTKS